MDVLMRIPKMHVNGTYGYNMVDVIRFVSDENKFEST